MKKYAFLVVLCVAAALYGCESSDDGGGAFL